MPIKVIRGEDRVFNIKFVNKTTNEPYDLSAITQISVKFNNAIGSTQAQLTKTIGSGVVIVSTILGKIQVSLSDLDTTTLRIGERQNFEVTLDFGSTRRIVQFLTEWTVVDKLMQ
jgi:hypothetical protein